MINGSKRLFIMKGEYAMAYGNENVTNSNQKQRSQTQLNSVGVSFRSVPARKYMNTSYWDSCFCIGIGNYTEEAMRDFRVAPPANVNQAMTFMDIAKLNDLCDEVRQSIKQTGWFESAGIIVGSRKNNMVEINNGASLGMEKGIYLVIYKNLGEDLRCTHDMDFYPFGGSEIIRNYDPRTGSHKIDKNAFKEFKDFCVVVEEAMRAFTNATAHTVHKAVKFKLDRQLELMNKIAEKNGIDVSYHSKPMSTNNFADARAQKSGYQQSQGSKSAPWSNPHNFPYGQTDDPIDLKLDPAELDNVPFS